MELRKLAAALTAAVTAVVPLISGGMTASARTTKQNLKIPDWVPYNFETALEFRNTYGGTHVDGRFACVAFQKCYDENSADFTKARFTTHYNEKIVKCAESGEYIDTSFSREEGFIIELYLFYATEEGRFWISFEDTLGENADRPVNDAKTKYVFDIDSDLNFTETDIYSWLPDCDAEYRDYVDKNGAVSVNGSNVVFCLDSGVATGYSWQEKSQDYENYVEYIGSRSCSLVTPEILDGGTAQRVEVYSAKADGYADIEWDCARSFDEGAKPAKTLTADCAVFDDAQAVLLAGQTRATVLDSDTGVPYPSDILKNHPFIFGTDITIKTADGDLYTGPFHTVNSNPTIYNSDLAKLYFSADRFIFTSEEQPVVKTFENGSMDLVFSTNLKASGDVNNDGSFGVADAVALQKWLLGAETAEYFDWAAGDICMDNRLDVFDLVMLRKKLLSEDPVAVRSEPLLVIENGALWKQQQDIIVYDESGAAYHVYNIGGTADYGDNEILEIEKDVPLVRMGGDGWYEALENIVSKPEARYTKLKLDSDTLAAAKEISAKADIYSTVKSLPEQTRWLDGNTLTVYIVNREGEKPSFAKLCTLLGMNSCLDSKEVQEFVLELCRKDYIDYPDLDAELEAYLENAKK